MSLNRYRLQHLAKKNHRGAKRVSSLLRRPDRLIGVILIGNNMANIWATAIVTVIGVRLYGEAGILIATTALTLALLIFAEVAPKTLAAYYPERIAFPASTILRPLLWLFYPLVVIVNTISNGLVRIFGVNPAFTRARLTDSLLPEELRTVVDEAGDSIPEQHQGMLLNVLDLEKATAEDIMVPRHEVMGIDLEDDIHTILATVRSSEYTLLPVFEGDINNIVGVLHLRNAARFIHGEDATVSHEAIREQMYTPYFVHESTPLHIQLFNFQKEKRRFALVVDEYGDVQGIITLIDLLEEIVGDFSTDIAHQTAPEITPLDDDWFLIYGAASVRDINRHLNWGLPIDGPKTINGVIIEFLENIPDGLCSFTLDNYQFEVTRLTDTRIEATKIRKTGKLSLPE